MHSLVLASVDRICKHIDTPDLCALVKTVSSTKFEPRHEFSNNVVCATSKGSDQPAHMGSLIRAFASRLNIL